MERDQATAIWVYAPGYINGESSVDGIAATTKMDIRVYDEPKKSGSRYAFDGKWVAHDQEFGVGRVLEPMFYIDDENADPLAYYVDSDYVSAAIKRTEDGWTSVYICEPIVPKELLREILEVLEVTLFLESSSGPLADLMIIEPNLAVIIPAGDGERRYNLGGLRDVTNLFNPEQGWTHKSALTVDLNDNETYLFHMSTLVSSSPPGDIIGQNR